MNTLKQHAPLGLATFALSSLVASVSHAHIDMLGTIQGRNGDQKAGPCEGMPRGSKVYVFEPGAVITLGVTESVAHPSYFRVAFDNDGEDAFKEPVSIKPIDPKRDCPFQGSANDKCTASDFCNVSSATGGASVLYDNIDPHLGEALDFVSARKTFTWQVKLPEVECTNCTLQVLQVMEDTVHGPYCPEGQCSEGSNYVEDLYHRCIDIQLKRGAGNTPGTATGPVNVKGIDCVAMAKSANPTVPVMAPSTPGATDAGTPVASNVNDAGADGGPSVPPVSDAGVIAPASGDAGSVSLPAYDAGAFSQPASDGGTLPQGASAPDAGAVQGVAPANVTTDGADSGCNAGARRPSAAAAWSAMLGGLLVGAFLRRRRRAA
jgi:hypothetical protein